MSDCRTFRLTYPFKLVLLLLVVALRRIIDSEPPSPFDDAYALRNMRVSSFLRTVGDDLNGVNASLRLVMAVVLLALQPRWLGSILHQSPMLSPRPTHRSKQASM